MTEIEQGSAEWFAIRCGKVTASRVSDVIAKTRSGWGASRANYAAQLIAERLTGTVAESYSNAAMQWGIDTEPQARAAYEFHTDATVAEIGFVDHPTIDMSGASPDGLVGDDGLVEIKCPSTSTHIDTLLKQNVPGKYLTQMQWQMACSERLWCDYVSFDPRMPANMSLFIRRIERDPQRIDELERLVIEFLREVSGKVDELNAAYSDKAAA